MNPFRKFIKQLTDVTVTGVLFVATTLISLSNWFRGNYPPPPDPTPFIFVLTPESIISQESDRSLESLRRELDVCSVGNEDEIASYETFDELTDLAELTGGEEKKPFDVEQSYTEIFEVPGENLPIDSLKEILNKIHSKKELLYSKQYQYSKLTLLLEQVGLKLAECISQINAMSETATLDDIFRVFQPIIEYYLSEVDEETHLAIISLGQELKFLTDTLKKLAKKKAILEKKAEMLKKNISRFSTEEGFSIKTKIEAAQDELAAETHYYKDTLDRFTVKFRLATGCLYLDLRFILESETSSRGVIKKIDERIRNHAEPRLQRKLRALDRLPQEIECLERKVDTFRQLQFRVPLDTGGWVRLRSRSPSVPCVLTAGPSRETYEDPGSPREGWISIDSVSASAPSGLTAGPGNDAMIQGPVSPLRLTAGETSPERFIEAGESSGRE